MNETEYPQWLVRRLASVLALTVDDTPLYELDAMYPDLECRHSQDYIDEWEDGAKAVLADLEFYRVNRERDLWRSEYVERDTK